MKVENWCGHDIRFVEINGEWWAILKDVCDALNLRSKDVSQRLDPKMIERVRINASDIDSNHVGSKAVSTVRTSRARKTRDMLAVNEIGIYEALFASRRLEARKFRRWSATVMQKLRRGVGLDGYEVMKMTNPEVQEDIDRIIDTLFWDEETGKLMQSVTVRGGDVEQVEFE